ncbi:hypothetical protein [Streptomyces sp. NPDC013489]|uniref:hypothetical protein n=1 Tax=Streptomyces sp. NPDC013489 TaxID=3155606 RepID=UPI00340A3984
MRLSTDWWDYDGSLRRPTAASMRGRCACGWRGERTVPLDWERVSGVGHDAYDVSGPEEDWETHMDDVATRAVPLPDDVSGLLRTLRQRLDALVDDEPLVVLKAAEEAEAIVADFGPIAARYLAGDAIPLARIAEALSVLDAYDVEVHGRLELDTAISEWPCRRGALGGQSVKATRTA